MTFFKCKQSGGFFRLKKNRYIPDIICINNFQGILLFYVLAVFCPQLDQYNL